MEGGKGEWWRVMEGEGGVVDSDEWGEGGGVGTDGRGGSAAGPSSFVCTLVILSMGGRYVWVACCSTRRDRLTCWRVSY